jgi:hypothetical protein
MRKTLGLLCLLSTVSLLPNDAHAITDEEGFLYSIIGCTNAFKRSEQEDKTEAMINLVHHFSEAQNITEVQSGYVTRYIKLVEMKWAKEYEVAKRNCDGIYEMAIKETKPATYNPVALSVIEYMHVLESKEKKKPVMPTAKE